MITDVVSNTPSTGNRGCIEREYVLFRQPAVKLTEGGLCASCQNRVFLFGMFAVKNGNQATLHAYVV